MQEALHFSQQDSGNSSGAGFYLESLKTLVEDTGPGRKELPFLVQASCLLPASWFFSIQITSMQLKWESHTQVGHRRLGGDEEKDENMRWKKNKWT